jgi:hypothetical protein
MVQLQLLVSYLMKNISLSIFLFVRFNTICSYDNSVIQVRELGCAADGDRLCRLDPRVLGHVRRALRIPHCLAVTLAACLEQVHVGAARTSRLDVLSEACVRVEHHLGVGITHLSQCEVRLGGLADMTGGDQDHETSC